MDSFREPDILKSALQFWEVAVLYLAIVDSSFLFYEKQFGRTSCDFLKFHEEHI